ncbi:histidinol-phosphatase HisJ [bacterium]|nr:histidinol-phosphatase HisJ [bacterium]
MLNFFVDMHIHTHYCGHASGSIIETVETAIIRGLHGIAFTCHCPYPAGFKGDIDNAVMLMDSLEDYWNDTTKARNHFSGKLEIRRGIEIDFIPGYEHESEQILTGKTYDVVLGSIHMLDGITIDYSDCHLESHMEALGSVDGIWNKYWNQLEALIHSDLCDVITHFDLPRRLVSLKPEKDYYERVEAIFDAMLARGKVMEINTGGIDRACDGKSYPALWIMKMAAERKLPICLGSDAHAPGEVGRYFDIVSQQLLNLGFKTIVDFIMREPVEKAIPKL